MLASGKYFVERITPDVVKSRRPAVRQSKTDARALEDIAAASGRQVLGGSATEQAGETITPE